MTDPDNIRGLIRENFDYLVKVFGFVEYIDITTDNIYSEVRYKKNGWTLSIVTTAHGTKISISLISPSGEFGFLSHFFNILDSNYANSINKVEGLVDNILYNSNFLKLNGHDILESKLVRMNEILEIIRTEQENWVKPLSRKQSDE